MISWDLGGSGGGTGIRLREGTAGTREIRLANTGQNSRKYPRGQVISWYWDNARW